MRIAITGEKGFIAKNLIERISRTNNDHVSVDFLARDMLRNKKGEICVYSNSVQAWASFFEKFKVDLVVHNAAVVGTDVVALNPTEAINTNVLGTQKIVEAANISDIPVLYLGTTVIYDTYKYQDRDIVENSDVFPRTNYAIQKYAGEMIVRNNAKKWLVARPLFAFGGIGDMNSLIAKTFYAAKNKIDKIDMFLDPSKVKDYMHVYDFCDAVIRLANSGVLNDDFNITAENPYNTGEIVQLMSEICDQDLFARISWQKDTDYLGNHRLSRAKFSKAISNAETISLREGIKMSWESINNSSCKDYNPLSHLEEASAKNIELKSFFPSLNK